MNRHTRMLAGVAVVTAIVLLAPAVGFAQSSIAGVARDESGGVLPGVTVEAASPVLIEKVRSVTTDSQGIYRIVDVRPGVYSVTFSLGGFNTFKRDGVTLDAGVTATVNGEMKVGALAETITVTGEAPVVDVQSSVKQQVLNRDLLDTIPTGRQIAQVGVILPGVVLPRSTVGGAGGIQTPKMSVHGTGVNDTSLEVDGVPMNSLSSGGSTLAYLDDAMAQEMNFQTSAISADTQTGGVRLNIIPREGGNTFSGALFGATVPSASFQSDNFTEELRKRGLGVPNRVMYLHDYNISLGGPIKRDRLWFFTSYRDLVSDETVSDAFFPDGRQLHDDNYLRQGMGRLTLQATSKNKIAGYYDLQKKYKAHEDVVAGAEAAATSVRPGKMPYITGQAKWTSAVSSKLLLETGFAVNGVSYSVEYQPGIKQERGTPAWYQMVAREDTILGTLRVAAYPEDYRYNLRKTLASSATYVTGSHSFKTGMQWGWGGFRRVNDMNGDLIQRYLSGVPDSVLVYNTLVETKPYLKADLGVFVQDSWTRKRMTINAGLRWDYLNAFVEEQSSPAGRFVPARHFDEYQAPTLNDLSPRFGVSYDLFGDGRTAVKGSISKYVARLTQDFAETYNPMIFASDPRTWNDLNLDDIAQDNEIGPSNNSRFGVQSSRRPDPDIKREYNVEYSVSLDRELLPGVSASVAYYRRGFHRLVVQDNILISPADYTPVNIVSPLNGEQLTVYNLDSTKRALVDIVDRNSPDNTRTYNGIEMTAQIRTARGGRIVAGLTRDRTAIKNCSLDDPNATGGRFCDQTTLSIPLQNQFKLTGFYPLPLWGMEISGALVSFPGAPLNVNYSVGRAIIPGLTQTSVTVPLVAPGTKYLAQRTQLDFALGKSINFEAGRRLRLQFNLFNALNSSVVETTNQAWGRDLDRPTAIMQGRLIRIGAQFHF